MHKKNSVVYATDAGFSQIEVKQLPHDPINYYVAKP
jgi:hypothetical protein